MKQKLVQQIKEKQANQSKQILEKLVKSFENPEFLHDAVIKTFLDPIDVPQNKYSRMNRILLAIQVSYDARGSSTWRQLNRFPLDWSKQVFIMMPRTQKIKKKDEEYTKKTNLSDREGDVYAFFYDLDLCLEQLSHKLKRGKSHLCFVVANRMVRREKIPMDEILVEIGRKYDFKHKDTIYRTIANKAMAVKNAPENISNFSGDTMNQESIVIFDY